MRITSGIFGSRILETPKTGDIRPTQDMVRQALFSMLGEGIAGARFLDLFAGSGAVGLEALSRGAAYAAFVEADPRHVAVIERNIAALRVAEAVPGGAAAFRIYRRDAYKWIESCNGESFDIVFADPPYALGAERGYPGVLEALASRGIVKPGGMFIAETAASQPVCGHPLWETVKDRTYGKTRLALYRRK